jgi:nanoRNase/pAp phosphatase (c-di-AMP/oligoRNAs hydrolase)
MKKKMIETIHEKNSIINSIIAAILERKSFLIIGHLIPDEDCIGSMVAAALIISKFSKDIQVFFDSGVHEHFQYLINICEYNSIRVVNDADTIEKPVDTIIMCDTPKLSMVSDNRTVRSFIEDKDILKIEIDHHLGADSEYIGDKGYCFVTEASSASELVGLVALKLMKRADILQQYNITNFLTRNIVLSVLTGIIGDSKMGQFLKSKREKRYYRIFSDLYNRYLVSETVKSTNFMNMEQVFNEIQRLSNYEERCYNYIMGKKGMAPSVGYVVLNTGDMKILNNMFENDIIVNTMRVIADDLAEESGKVSLVVSDDEESDLIQFRMRRSHHYKSYDVREVLTLFSIDNGGGHEGAIGFRLKRGAVPDLDAYVQTLIAGVGEVLP